MIALGRVSKPFDEIGPIPRYMEVAGHSGLKRLYGPRFADEVALDRGLIYKAIFPRKLDVIGRFATEGESS